MEMKKNFLCVLLFFVWGFIWAPFAAGEDCKSALKKQLAVIESVGASDVFENHAPENVFDGDFNSLWSTDGDNHWIMFTLSKPTKIDRVQLAWLFGNGRNYFFDIELSDDGKVWRRIFNGKSNGKTLALETFEFEPVVSRYLRIVSHGNSANGFNNLTEVRIGSLIYCDKAKRPINLDSLPAIKQDSLFKLKSFHIGKGAPSIYIYGFTGASHEPAFFKEFLPAFFSRTLVAEQINLDDGHLLWIFTGDRGGFTIRLDKEKLQVHQRFYNSFGLHSLENEGKWGRYPEKRWTESEKKYTGTVRSLGVTVDSNLFLKVFLSGQEVIKQKCMLDVNRHQIKISGEQSGIKATLYRNSVKKTTVHLDLAKKHQKILGFGGITTPSAYHQLSEKGKEQWWKILAEYRLLIHREYPIGTQLKKDLSNWDDLDDAVPHYYGDNFPNSEISDFNYIKAIRKIDGMVWFEFWELPGWMKQDWTDSKGQLHRGVANPEIYASTVVNYCQKSLDKAGMPPDIVGIQNEKPQPPEIWHQMTLKLRQALDKAGFRKVKIHMTDCPSAGGAHTWVNWYKNSEAAWKAIDYAATHMYDYQGYFTRPDEFDSVLRILKERTAEKPFLSTELCINWPDKQILSYRSAFAMGQLYHKNLVISDASAICYCWLLLNVTQPSFGWTRSLFVPDKANGFVPRASSYQLRVFGAFSRRIKRDMVRVDAVSSDNDILASGFVSDDGCQTVILLNRSLESHLVSVTGTQQQFRWIEITDPYKENEIRKLNPGSKKEANEIRVEPGAIVTLTNVALGKLPRDFAISKN